MIRAQESMFLAPANKLKQRGELMAASRCFFADRDVIEVDVPMLSEKAPVDVHIDLVQACALGKNAFLHSSPEYGMKKLLAAGSGDIYQLSHVFRDLESGSRHAIEFTMVEWYRLGFTLHQLIEEVFQFVQLFIPIKEYELRSYDSLWRGHNEESFALNVEPTLGQGKATFIVDYPPSEAALAQVNDAGFAERFELFIDGIELANGYHELADPIEQKQRLEEANQERLNFGKQAYPIDEDFVSCLQTLPDCCGVAVGFDRLMMLRNNTQNIEDILPYDRWSI